MMSRAEFLSKVWQPYPKAEPGWLDVRTFLVANQSEAMVAGRLRKNAAKASAAGSQAWSLHSAGQELSFSFAPRVSSHIFASGDLVAVRLSNANGEWVANEALLLFPTSEPTAQDASPREAAAFGVGRSREWAQMLAAIRQFFSERDFIEAQTPTLVPSPGTEPFLDPFSTEWEIGSTVRRFYLPTSPEFHLKQMLVEGWTRIFEFKNCFRNGEIGDHHQPEFLMLEWYRAYANLDAIADDVDGLLQALSATLAQNAKRHVPRLQRTTIAQLFHEAFDGFVLTPSTTREELARLAVQVGVSFDPSDSFDDVFFRLFLEKIESRLGIDGPLLVSHYPPSQAALSRIGEHGFAERFEVYWNGLELANAFHELNDPVENEKRFADDQAKKAALGKPAVPRDENLVRALKKGMPPSGGIAMGIDRLFMALFQVPDIAATRAFPITR